MKSNSPIFNVDHIRPVPVIASFNDSGEILPLYVKIHGSEYKILKCNFESRNVNYINFKCRIEVFNMYKEFILIYSISNTAWFVPSEYLS